MADTQTLPNAILPPISTEDEELKERERQIWEKINRGPRERADELTAKGWKDRYGITPESGKLARTIAGLGEIGRSITTRGKGPGIADVAKADALKEYQAEVGPLQRELGVLSSEKRAQAALAQKNAYQNEKMLQDAYVQERRLGQTDEQIVQKGIMSRAQIAKIKADIALTQEKTEGQSLANDFQKGKNAVAAKFGGLLPTGAMGNAFGLNTLGQTNPGEASGIVDTARLFQSAANTGKGSNGSLGKQTVRVPYLKEVMGWDSSGAPHISRVPSEKVYRENIPVPAGQATKPVKGPSWYTGTGEPAQAPTSPPNVGSLNVTPVKPGKTYRVTSQGGDEYISEARPANIIRQRVDPTHAVRLGKRFGIDPKEFEKFQSTRFPDWVGPVIKEKSERASARQNYYRSLSDLSRLAANAYGNNETDNISGLLVNFENSLKAMTGELPPEAINIRQAAIDTVATRILELSGKAVTNQERALYMKSLPNLGTDSAATFTAKAMILKHMLDMRSIFEDLRLTDNEIDRLYSTRNGAILAGMAGTDFKKLEGLRMMIAKGEPLTIGKTTFTDPAAAAKAIKEGHSPAIINLLLKKALAEAGITDALPLK